MASRAATDATDAAETPSTASASTPTIVVGHSSRRTDVPDGAGVAYLESNSSFDDLRTGLRSALERVLPC